MTLCIWLVRHGESTWNAEGRVQGWADPPLSERGMWQAQQAALRLADEPLSAIYTSTLQRASSTADIIGSQLNLTPVREDRLREHGMGDATGMVWTRELAFERWPHLREVAARNISIHSYIPGAEPLRAFRARVKSVFADIRKAHSEGHVGVVAHGGVFWVYVAHLMGAKLGGPTLNFGNASLSLIEYASDGRIAIRFVNEICHTREMLHT